MCKTERRSLFRPIHVRTNIGASIEYLCQDKGEGDDRAKTLFLQATFDINQNEPVRVNIKEPLELEPLKKIDEIRRISNKELRLTK